jgi:PIN domain nuclease of toxin-antitoxin system
MALIDTVIIVRILLGQSSTKRDLLLRQNRRGSPIHFSSVSILEIANKTTSGRLALPGPLHEIVPGLEAGGLVRLDLAIDHILRAQDFNHPDPYDRLLLAQADLANLSFITADRALLKFPNVIEI